MVRQKIGILLAGGASRRFGQPKAFMTWQGRYFYDYVYKALMQVTDKVIIATRPQFIDRFPNELQTITDLEKYDGQGPLAAIYSVMAQTDAENYIVLPCDMPFVTADLLRILYNRHKQNEKILTFVEVDGYRQPLMSIWSKEAKGIIQAQLDRQENAMKAIYNKIPYECISSAELSSEAHLFQNINTVSQWEETLKWYKF